MSEISTLDSEETITCQFCKKPTPADFNFCVECDQQIKCLNCSRKTFPGKTYCLACAQPLVEKPATSQAPNQYERSVKQDGDKYEENTRFALSDNAVHEIAPFIINQTMPGAKGRMIGPNTTGTPNGQTDSEVTEDTTYEDATPKKDSKPDNNEHIDNQASADNTSEGNAAHNSQLNKFFKKDGDALVATENDFKGQNWAEQQRNFVLLYTKAHEEILGRPVADKEAYKALAIKLNLLDPSNFTTYVNKQVAAFMTKMSNGFVLNSGGEKELIKVIQLMEDESKKGHAYWSRPATGPKQQSHLSKEDRNKIATWVKESGDIDFGKLDIRDITVARDYALLSLWLVIHRLKKASAVKWNEAFLFLTSKYDTTSVNGNAFSKAVAAKENEKFFTKNGEGLYYLTYAGQQLVEDWVSGKKSAKKESSKS